MPRRSSTARCSRSMPRSETETTGSTMRENKGSRAARVELGYARARQSWIGGRAASTPSRPGWVEATAGKNAADLGSAVFDAERSNRRRRTAASSCGSARVSPSAGGRRRKCPRVALGKDDDRDRWTNGMSLTRTIKPEPGDVVRYVSGTFARTRHGSSGTKRVRAADSGLRKKIGPDEPALFLTIKKWFSLCDLEWEARVRTTSNSTLSTSRQCITSTASCFTIWWSTTFFLRKFSAAWTDRGIPRTAVSVW